MVKEVIKKFWNYLKPNGSGEGFWKRLLHNERLKEKLYIIIFESDTFLGKAFDVALIAFIAFSVLITVIESVSGVSVRYGFILSILEWIFTVFFTFEYLVRVYCAPQPKKYVYSFFGVIDFLATFPPYLQYFLPGSQYFLIFRIFRLIRIFRVFKLFNFLSEGNLLLRSLQKSFNKIFVFFLFVVILVVCIGTMMYIVEGDEQSGFSNIPNSIYWAIVTLTTVGYGDITPVTPLGRFLSEIVMLLGYTIIAVPTGIVSASMMKEHKKHNNRTCPNCHRIGHDEDAIFCKYCGKELREY